MPYISERILWTFYQSADIHPRKCTSLIVHKCTILCGNVKARSYNSFQYRLLPIVDEEKKLV